MTHQHLSGSLEGTGEALHVLLDLTVATEELNVGTVLAELALLAELNVVVTAEGGEAPVLGDDDLLATGELVHGAAESLESGGAVGVTGTDRQDDLADVDTGDETVGLSQAPRIPVCSLSAPAHDNILLIRTTWKGWTRTRRWKPSFPAILTRYLLTKL